MSSIPRKPSCAAFTLMEVIVVLTLVAALASAALIVAPRMRRTAQTTASMNNLRQIHMLMSGYVTENNGNYPISVYQNETGSPTWRRKVWERTNGPFEGSPPQIMESMQQSGYASVMWCPMMVKIHGQDQHPEGRGSYSINRFFVPAAWGGGTRNVSAQNLIGRREPYIVAGTLFQGDKRFGTFYHVDSSKDPADTYWANFHYAYGADGESALGLYIDGHTATIPKAEGVRLAPLIADPQNLE